MKKQKRRRLRKPIRRFLQTLVFAPAAAVSDLVIISWALTDQNRVFWILLMTLCLLANAWLAYEIYEKPERRVRKHGRRESVIREDIAA